MATHTPIEVAKKNLWRTEYIFHLCSVSSENPVTLADKNLATIRSASTNNQYNTQHRVLCDDNLTQSPPWSANFILTSDSTIVQIINHRYNLGDNKATFYTACPPEFVRYFFTPNPTYPYAATSQLLGYPAGEHPNEEAVHIDCSGYPSWSFFGILVVDMFMSIWI